MTDVEITTVGLAGQRGQGPPPTTLPRPLEGQGGGGGTRRKQAAPRKRRRPPLEVLLRVRGVRRGNCRHCGARVYRGLDDDRIAMEAIVDIHPVDYLTEVTALLSGRHSYDLVRDRLYFRESVHYKNAARKYPVLISHRCKVTY